MHIRNVHATHGTDPPIQLTKSNPMPAMVNSGSTPSKTYSSMSIGRSLDENLMLTDLHHHKSSFSTGMRLSPIRFSPYLMWSQKILYRSKQIWCDLTNMAEGSKTRWRAFRSHPKTPILLEFRTNPHSHCNLLKLKESSFQPYMLFTNSYWYPKRPESPELTLLLS